MKGQLRDVKVVRGAEIGSDHHLVLMVIKLKVEKPSRSRVAGGSIRVKEVQEAVRAKKLAYRKLLDQGSEEAKVAYNKAKKEAKMRVRKAKNEEWSTLGEEMEKGCQGHAEKILAMQKRFWPRVRAKERETTTHIRGLDGELRSGEEAMTRWREHSDNLLNGEAGSGEEITADGNEVQNEEGGIEVEEVERAVRKLKVGKQVEYVVYR